MDGRCSWIALLVATLLPLTAAIACTSPSAPPPASPFAPAPPGTAQFPGQVIDLANWYLTLPTGDSNRPDEVHQPRLNTFTNPWFHLDDTRTGVVFTANAGGVTTKSSTYPRSELREMTGTEKASWSNTSGNHVLRLRQAVTRLPVVKPHVVTARCPRGCARGTAPRHRVAGHVAVWPVRRHDPGANTSPGTARPRAELVLALHQHGEPMVQRALARVLRCTPRHITGLVDALEQRDLVRRTIHPTDRRAVLVALTAAGRASARWLTEQRADAAHALFADRPDRELKAFVAVAEYMLARLDGR